MGIFLTILWAWAMFAMSSAFTVMPTKGVYTSSLEDKRSECGSARETKIFAIRPGFDDQFNRWRYLQNFLDGDEDSAEANEILFEALDAYIRKPRIPGSAEETGSPELTNELEKNLDTAMALATGRKFEYLGDDEPEESLQSALEALLPDPREQEDDNKSVWDTVMELHGREMVKYNETNPTPEWKKLCLVARLLIHFDFLTEGIPER